MPGLHLPRPRHVRCLMRWPSSGPREGPAREQSSTYTETQSHTCTRLHAHQNAAHKLGFGLRSCIIGGPSSGTRRHANSGGLKGGAPAELLPPAPPACQEHSLRAHTGGAPQKLLRCVHRRHPAAAVRQRSPIAEFLFATQAVTPSSGPRLSPPCDDPSRPRPNTASCASTDDRVALTTGPGASPSHCS